MRVALYVLFLLTSASSLAQQRVRWSSFERLQFEEVFDKESSMWMQVPKWTDKDRQ